MQTPARFGNFFVILFGENEVTENVEKTVELKRFFPEVAVR
jgi:hypothetical protein